MIRAIAIAILISLSSAAESPSEFVTRAISPYVISVISPVQEGDRSDPGHIFQVQTIVSKDAEGNARKVTQKFTPDGADSFVMINGLIKNFDPAVIEDDLLTQGATKLAELIDSPDPVPGIGKVVSGALYVRHQGTSAVVLQLSFTDNTNGAYVAWIKSNGELGLYPAVL